MQAVSGYYGYLFAKDDEKKAEAEKKVKDNLKTLAAYLEKHGKPYICGDKPGMTDYMVWPHLEKMFIMNPDFVKDSSILQGYCDRMEADEAVKECRHSNEMHKQILEAYREGNINYDIGTVTEY